MPPYPGHVDDRDFPTFKAKHLDMSIWLEVQPERIGVAYQMQMANIEAEC